MAVAGVALLVSAWAATNPMSGAPDELDHELRALSIGRGEVVGQKLPNIEAAPAEPQCCASNNASARSWVERGARIVRVPSKVDPMLLPCNRVVAGQTRRCDVPRQDASFRQEITTMGTIEAAAYVPSALASRLAWSPFSALMLTRFASAACALALTALGLLALRLNRRGPWAVVGALFALTPGVVLVFSTPSPNAIEISAAFAFFAGMLAASEAGPLSRVEVAAAWLGAFGLVASRSLGPGWLILLTLIVIALNGTSELRRRLARDRRTVAGAALVGAALLVTVVWEAVVQPHVPFNAAFFVHQIKPAFDQHMRISHEYVGVFGSVNLPMHAFVYAWWLRLLAVLGVAAVVVGTMRERLVVAGVFGLSIAAFVGISAALLRQNGFDVQARHVLPVVMTLPVVAGVVLGRHLSSRWSVAAVGAGAFVAVVQLTGWAMNTATYAPGPAGVAPKPVWGREMFRLAFDRRGWALVALAGVALLATAPLVATREAP